MTTPHGAYPGRDVLYETDRRGGLCYYLPAKIVVTEENQAGPHPTADSPYPDLEPVEDGCVHLVVFTPGPGSTYTELNVPFDDRIAEDGHHHPRTWWFPDQV